MTDSFLLSLIVGTIVYMIAFSILDRYDVPFWAKLTVALLCMIANRL